MLLNSIRKYNLLRRFYESKTGKKWIRNKLASVLPYLDKADNIIDIGCGNGLISQKLTENGYHCTPVDVADLSIANNINVIVYDGRHLPYQDKSFDVALLLTVLHHCEQPLDVLQESLRVASRVIIIEDIYSNKIQQYLTYGMDTLVNLGHSNMTYQNKTDSAWKAAFDELGCILKASSSKNVLGVFRQATYVLERPSISKKQD